MAELDRLHTMRVVGRGVLTQERAPSPPTRPPQDDFLDCYGDPEVIGKIGTDIEDSKCSWLVVTALKRANPEQKAVLQEHYGKSSKDSVAKVKALYVELDVKGAFEAYEQKSYEDITGLINQEKVLPHGLFLFLLKKIYRRSK